MSGEESLVFAYSELTNGLPPISHVRLPKHHPARAANSGGLGGPGIRESFHSDTGSYRVFMTLVVRRWPLAATLERT